MQYSNNADQIPTGAALEAANLNRNQSRLGFGSQANAYLLSPVVFLGSASCRKARNYALPKNTQGKMPRSPCEIAISCILSKTISQGDLAQAGAWVGKVAIAQRANRRLNAHHTPA
jgi:hypothetical protein